jgi:peptide/nickel transport system ATP-binding protein
MRAVDDLSFELIKGQTIAIVGESGSGKTSTGKAIVDLVEKTEGRIYINGIYLSKIHERFRRKIQIVFQDVHSSLNPKMTILDTITEGLRIYETDPKKIKNKLHNVLHQVGLESTMLSRFPHQLSGGQKQRVAIARSLILSPDILILDEPTSALDVSIQAQILTLLKKIQRKYLLSYLLITHDISVVGYMADKIFVMYKGKLVESGSTQEILTSAKHPYTKILLNSIPNNINFSSMAQSSNLFSYREQSNNQLNELTTGKVSFSDTHHVYYHGQ